MMKKLLTVLLAALFLCASLPAAAEGDTVTVTDMFGRTVTVKGNVTRVVALSAAECEIVCALGCEELLVGRGEYCDYPASVQSLPTMLSGSETNIEQILALEPQVLLMSGMDQTDEQIAQLEANGVRVIISYAQNIEGVFSSIRLIGAALGRNEAAEELIAGMQASFDAVSAAAAKSGKTVYFEVSPLEWGLWTAGNGTFMDEIAEICGLENVFSDVNGWAEISEEQVLERDPDCIVTVTMYYGEGPMPAEEILSRPGWQSVKAVKDGAVVQFDSDMLTRPGPRLAEAARLMYETLLEDTAEKAA